MPPSVKSAAVHSDWHKTVADDAKSSKPAVPLQPAPSATAPSAHGCGGATVVVVVVGGGVGGTVVVVVALAGGGDGGGISPPSGGSQWKVRSKWSSLFAPSDE